ncbi:MAG: hypothetical protein NTW69_16260 [Chloroflexi bacterium]|nr:hypothetical protein [Chloroflexota bacterium]
MHLWRLVLDQKGENIVNLFGIGKVIIVKDEDKIVLDGGYLIEQCNQN